MQQPASMMKTKRINQLETYLQGSPTALKGVYYSFTPDMKTWQQWEREHGQDTAALKECYKQWVAETREYFDELNHIFTDVKNWALQMWFAKPEFLIDYAFSHQISENYLDNRLRKEFEDLVLTNPSNSDWQVPLPTQRVLKGSKKEGGKLGALLRCLIRETIAPVRSHTSLMLLHSILLLYLCRASERMKSQAPQDQKMGFQFLESFFTSQYLPNELMHFVWDMYGALQSGHYEAHLQVLTTAKKKDWNALDLSSLKEAYQQVFGKGPKATKQETLVTTLQDKENQLRTELYRRYQSKARINRHLDGLIPNGVLWAEIGDLVWQVPRRIELEQAWKNLRNFFASLYVLQELKNDPEAKPKPRMFLQDAHLWTIHYPSLKDLFTHPDPQQLAHWIIRWAYIVSKLHEWKRIRGARLLFLGRLLKQKGIIRAAHQLGTNINLQTLEAIHSKAPLDCVQPGDCLPIQFSNGNLNFSQDQNPIMPSAFLRYYLVDAWGQPYTVLEKRVSLNQVRTASLPLEAQLTAQIGFEVKIPPSLTNKRQKTLSIKQQPNLYPPAGSNKRWTTTRVFGAQGVPPYLVHQYARTYQRPTLIFSKSDAQGLPVLHFGLEADQSQMMLEKAKPNHLLIKPPPKPKESIRVLALDPGTRNPLGYALLEYPRNKKLEDLLKTPDDRPRTIETFASSPKFHFSKWNIKVLYTGVLAGLNREARDHAKKLVWQHYNKENSSNNPFATLEARDRIIEKRLAQIDRKIGHRYNEIQLLQKRRDQAIVVQRQLAQIIGCDEDKICFQKVKRHFTSLPELTYKTQREQAQIFLQQPNVKTTPLAELTPERFWRVLYDVPRLPLLEKSIRELYQKNNAARRTSTHLLTNYLLELADVFDCDLIAMENLKDLRPTTDAKTGQLTHFQQEIQQLANTRSLQEKALQDPTKTLQNRLKRFGKQTRQQQESKEHLERKWQRYRNRKVQKYFDHLLDLLRMRAGLDPQTKARRNVSNWPRGLLATMLQRKLNNRKDLHLIVVRPEGTSIRCCECHQQGIRNRQADTFRCQNKACRYDTEFIHSEAAASNNIGLLGIWGYLSIQEFNN